MVESRPGAGSRFAVKLPVTMVDATAVAPVAAQVA
jgi:hypothetical protein